MSLFTEYDFHNLSALESSIIDEIKKLAKGDNKEEERIKRSYQKLPNNGCLSHNQLDLLAWQMGESLKDKQPTNIEGYLSLALAECMLCVDSLEARDVTEARTLIDDACNNLKDAKRNLEKSEVAQNPRPKKNPTNKTMTTEEMRKWRKNDHTFDEFMAAAQNHSVDGFDIEAIAGGKFLLSWTTTNDEKKSKNTLLDWWKDCNKKELAS